MTSLTIHLPRLDIHLLGEMVHTAGTRIHTALEHHEKHECKRYEFLEDALLSREMGRGV